MTTACGIQIDCAGIGSFGAGCDFARRARMDVDATTGHSWSCATRQDQPNRGRAQTITPADIPKVIHRSRSARNNRRRPWSLLITGRGRLGLWVRRRGHPGVIRREGEPVVSFTRLCAGAAGGCGGARAYCAAVECQGSGCHGREWWARGQLVAQRLPADARPLVLCGVSMAIGCGGGSAACCPQADRVASRCRFSGRVSHV